jgi:hypothetical protein
MRVHAALFCVMACLGVCPPVGAATHAHALPPAPAAASRSHPATDAGVAPTPAARFVADAALREGMASIRGSVLALEHARHGHLDAAQVRQRARAIRTDVNTIIAKCRLAPDADAALHPILAALLTQAAALERDPGKPTAAIDGLQAALRDYARLFGDGAPG